MTRFWLCPVLLSALFVKAQDRIPRNRVELLEQLQNDLSGALAHGGFSYDDRITCNEIDAILGKSIGAERGSQHADPRELKNTIKNLERLSKRSGMTARDRLKIERDCEDLKYNLEHGLPVYRGYHQPLKY